MELALLVYFVGLIGELQQNVSPLMGISLTWSIVVVVFGGIFCQHEGREFTPVLKKYIPHKTMITLLVIGILLPSESTMKYMAGAYVVQQVATSDKVKDLGNLSYEAARTQLQAWAKSEDPELTSKMSALVQQLDASKQAK